MSYEKFLYAHIKTITYVRFSHFETVKMGQNWVNFANALVAYEIT